MTQAVFGNMRHTGPTQACRVTFHRGFVPQRVYDLT